MQFTINGNIFVTGNQSAENILKGIFDVTPVVNKMKDVLTEPLMPDETVIPLANFEKAGFDFLYDNIGLFDPDSFVSLLDECLLDLEKAGANASGQLKICGDGVLYLTVKDNVLTITSSDEWSDVDRRYV